MSRKMSEARRNKELERLIDEQFDDLSSTCLFPETITPVRPSVLEGLANKEKAAILLSLIGRMSKADIADALSCNESSVRGFIRIGYRKLREKLAK